MSNFIPNTFQNPNAVVDELMYLLTPIEFKVLTFAIRHIIGWQESILERRAQIAISVFTDGFITKEGKHYHGTGLSPAAVRNAINALEPFNIIRRCRDEAGKLLYDLDGQWYELPFLLNEPIDMNALERRAFEQETGNKARTQKASIARRDRQPLTSDDTLSSDDTPPLTSHDRDTLTSDDTPPLTSDVTHETHSLKPIAKTPKHNSGGGVNDEDDYKPLDEQDNVYGRIARFYTSNINVIITEHIRDILIELIDTYPEDSILRAMQIAVEANKRSISYAKGVLKRMEVDGITASNKSATDEQENTAPVKSRLSKSQLNTIRGKVRSNE